MSEIAWTRDIEKSPFPQPATWGSASERDEAEFRNKSLPLPLRKSSKATEVEQFWYELDVLEHNLSRAESCLNGLDHWEYTDEPTLPVSLKQQTN
jgi:hypothetical protein